MNEVVNGRGMNTFMQVNQRDEPGWDDLLDGVRKADSEFIRTFAGRLGPAVFRFFCSLGLNPGVAEDLAVTCVTEITLKFLHKTDGFHGGNFLRWAFTVSRHILADEHRRQPDLVSVPPEALTNLAESMGSAAEKTAPSDVEAAMLEVLSQLSERDRHILLARSGREPTPFNVIAAEVGISEVNARVRNARASVQLKKLLMADKRIQRWLSRRSPGP
jgi:RNA polymerase sigma factor (sigma-70 family)